MLRASAVTAIALPFPPTSAAPRCVNSPAGDCADGGLLRVELCGVCGSDWPYYLKYPNRRGR